TEDTASSAAAPRPRARIRHDGRTRSRSPDGDVRCPARHFHPSHAVNQVGKSVGSVVGQFSGSLNSLTNGIQIEKTARMYKIQNTIEATPIHPRTMPVTAKPSP